MLLQYERLQGTGEMCERQLEVMVVKLKGVVVPHRGAPDVQSLSPARESWREARDFVIMVELQLE